MRVVGRMGRIVGYLEGPVRASVSIDVLEQATEDLLANLSPEQTKTFEENRSKVQMTFRDVVSNNEDRKKSEEEKVQQANEVELQNLANREVDIDNSLSQIGPQLTALQGEATRQISLAEQQVLPIQSRLGQIQSNINRDEAALAALTNDLFFYQNNYPNSLNISLILNSMRGVRFNLSNLYAQARTEQANLLVVQNQVLALRRQFDRQLSAMQKQIKDLEREKSRNRKRQAKLKTGPKIAKGKLSAYDNREKSVKTYMQYPLEFLRQDLIKKYL